MFKALDNCTDECMLVRTCSKSCMLGFSSVQHYETNNFPDVQAHFRKVRGTRYQIVNIWWIIEKTRGLQKNVLPISLTAKAFDCGIPGHLTCLLRNLYLDQEARIRTLYRTTDCFRIKKGLQHGCLLSPCLFNLYSEHCHGNARLDELQARLKIGRRNINNLKYVDDTTLMAESKEQLKNLLMRVKEENERVGLKLNIKKKIKIMASSPITSWQRRGKGGSSDRFLLLGL